MAQDSTLQPFPWEPLFAAGRVFIGSAIPISPNNIASLISTETEKGTSVSFSRPTHNQNAQPVHFEQIDSPDDVSEFVINIDGKPTYLVRKNSDQFFISMFPDCQSGFEQQLRTYLGENTQDEVDFLLHFNVVSQLFQEHGVVLETSGNTNKNYTITKQEDGSILLSINDTSCNTFTTFGLFVGQIELPDPIRKKLNSVKFNIKKDASGKVQCEPVDKSLIYELHKLAAVKLTLNPDIAKNPEFTAKAYYSRLVYLKFYLEKEKPNLDKDFRNAIRKLCNEIKWLTPKEKKELGIGLESDDIVNFVEEYLIHQTLAQKDTSQLWEEAARTSSRRTKYSFTFTAQDSTVSTETLQTLSGKIPEELFAYLLPILNQRGILYITEDPVFARLKVECPKLVSAHGFQNEEHSFSIKETEKNALEVTVTTDVRNSAGDVLFEKIFRFEVRLEEDNNQDVINPRVLQNEYITNNMPGLKEKYLRKKEIETFQRELSAFQKNPDAKKDSKKTEALKKTAERLFGEDENSQDKIPKELVNYYSIKTTSTAKAYLRFTHNISRLDDNTLKLTAKDGATVSSKFLAVRELLKRGKKNELKDIFPNINFKGSSVEAIALEALKNAGALKDVDGLDEITVLEECLLHLSSQKERANVLNFAFNHYETFKDQLTELALHSKYSAEVSAFLENTATKRIWLFSSAKTKQRQKNAEDAQVTILTKSIANDSTGKTLEKNLEETQKPQPTGLRGFLFRLFNPSEQRRVHVQQIALRSFDSTTLYRAALNTLAPKDVKALFEDQALRKNTRLPGNNFEYLIDGLLNNEFPSIPENQLPQRMKDARESLALIKENKVFLSLLPENTQKKLVAVESNTPKPQLDSPTTIVGRLTQRRTQKPVVPLSPHLTPEDDVVATTPGNTTTTAVPQEQLQQGRVDINVSSKKESQPTFDEIRSETNANLALADALSINKPETAPTEIAKLLALTLFDKWMKAESSEPTPKDKRGPLGKELYKLLSAFKKNASVDYLNQFEKWLTDVFLEKQDPSALLTFCEHLEKEIQAKLEKAVAPSPSMADSQSKFTTQHPAVTPGILRDLDTTLLEEKITELFNSFKSDKPETISEMEAKRIFRQNIMAKLSAETTPKEKLEKLTKLREAAKWETSDLFKQSSSVIISRELLVDKPVVSTVTEQSDSTLDQGITSSPASNDRTPELGRSSLSSSEGTPRDQTLKTQYETTVTEAKSLRDKKGPPPSEIQEKVIEEIQTPVVELSEEQLAKLAEEVAKRAKEQAKREEVAHAEMKELEQKHGFKIHSF